MKIPTATYRLQFRNGMTFDRAAALVPYLKRLGISHLYASPIFTATSGSTHGYDVTDANEIDPAIGGHDGFERMAKALKEEGLGLILDIVPNHMAASLENPWWRDVIENGEKSRYSRHFDIDWSRRLTLPFLGQTFEKALEAGEISVRVDSRTGNPALAYHESLYPLNPTTYAGREDEILTISDRTTIAELHDRQPYRLMSWRDAARDLSYRRFFEITGLAGIRVEDETVFDDSHRLILELVHRGVVDGLRIDHVDGLADPKAYLDRLRHKAGPDCHITVEKILGEGEHIRSDWPISGTTGYEFIAALSDVMVDNEGVEALRVAYETAIAQPVDMKAELRAAKLLMVERNFAGEVSILLKLAMQINRAAVDETALSENDVGTALRELLIAFPVYRTYGAGRGLPPEDRKMLAGVLETVHNSPNPPGTMPLDFLERLLVDDVDPSVADPAALFRTRFQQLTGPLMAKSVEDTLFFRHHALLALNEVGGEPLPRPFSLDRFHHDMGTRLEEQPDGLSGSSTHDTKRGEDARARLYTLTERPQAWADAVTRWRKMNKTAVEELEDGPASEPAVEWMLYQALAGAWPADLQPDDAQGLQSLEERFVAYVEKALREAKLRTDWAEPNEAYEKAVIDYARSLLSPDNQTFLVDFTKTLSPFIRDGLVNSVAQTIIKLTAPGIPDIYQGSESLNFSLVDPDNRREPDFSALERHLSEKIDLASPHEEDWLSGRLKQHLIRKLLHLRQDLPVLFRNGEYLRLGVTGDGSDRIVAFARTDDKDAVVVLVVPRNASNRISDAKPVLTLPPALANREYRNILDESRVHIGNEAEIAALSGGRSYAIFRTDD